MQNLDNFYEIEVYLKYYYMVQLQELEIITKNTSTHSSGSWS